MVDVAEESKRNVLAALFGHSNMGFERPTDLPHLGQAIRGKHVISVESAVAWISGHLIETDEHEEIFYAEAHGWRKYLDEEGLEKSKLQHSEIFEIYEKSIAPHTGEPAS